MLFSVPCAASEDAPPIEGTSRRERRNEALLDLSFSYGLPGKADYIYRRPFDYFNFEFSAVTSNIFENIMTRGLIVGRKYGAGDSYNGLWGLSPIPSFETAGWAPSINSRSSH